MAFSSAVASHLHAFQTSNLRLPDSNKSWNRRRRTTAIPVIRCEKVVGIDLGTTNSAVAAMEGGQPTIVTNAEGQRTTPSVVAYTKSGDRLVGQLAKRQAVVNPENTFFSVKRFIGRKMAEVDEEAKQVSYKVIADENGNVKLDCPAIGKKFAAEEISAQVLFFLFSFFFFFLFHPSLCLKFCRLIQYSLHVI
ncbi:stromal 70 kDa heat shock-related protein [Cucumis melo var. makuwa]|uniref:Stromal 70 kDa heat shock-related protein n=1 Tax=Cucumis melo var. makuwa TaxID=1194695 RepID=A0A5A7T9Z1_CUCMM|nr:stromal 70 kDa heat shock-related protein [Cucumis melo var. makuwa]TYK31526.1 stromal 70 kDa heat shock-related protein [Cucumis melo var. makuwa]